MAAGLPGLTTQLQMAPDGRGTIDVAQARLGDHRESAVMVLLYPRESGISILYTVRRADLKHHAGQISFPGGRREEGETLRQTALREAFEEVGVAAKAIDVVGSLTPLFIPPSRFIVYPYVAVTDRRPDFVIQESEVDALLEFDLATLTDPASRTFEARVPIYAVGNHKIWGATAMITAELLAVIDGINARSDIV